MSKLRINCHAHVFNFASVFTERTLEILLSRIKMNSRLSNSVADLMEPVLKQAMTKVGDRLEDPEDVLEKLLSKINIAGQAEGLATAIGDFLGKSVQLRGGDALTTLGATLLGDIWDAVRSWIISEKSWSDDAEAANWRDMINFLYIGLQPNISEVTDILMAGKADNEAVVALMMDITTADDQAGDEEQFVDQMKQTSQQVLNYPGRFFPFVAMHPERETCLTHVKDALDNLGFVGLKLYPGLGYALDQKIIRDALRECVKRQAPAMVHCTSVGFTAAGQAFQSAPEKWGAILEHDDFKELKVCFGHFGGAENMLDGLEGKGFTGQILDLMERFPGRVFADISYNEAPMCGEDDCKKYFDNLHQWLKDDRYKNQILYGTDFHLVCLRITEPHYHRFFLEKLGPDKMTRIEVDNPARYLGLPAGERLLAKNLESYRDFVYKNRFDCLRPAAAWLAQALKDEYGPENGRIEPIGDRSWNIYNIQHMRTYAYMVANNLYPSQVRRYGDDFKRVGQLAMSELTFWKQNFSAPDFHVPTVFSEATKLHQNLMCRCSCKDEEAAVYAMGKAMLKADTRIKDIGALVDKHYKCRWDDQGGQ